MAMKNLITVLVLAGCIGILQWHGIQFWSSQVDPATGWAWSLTLEGTALWLWWKGRRALGLCASLLLLVGPLYIVSEPLLADLGRAEHADFARERLIPAAEARVQGLEVELGAFLANSRKRAGWLAAIEAAQVRLEAARADLGRLYAERPESSGLGWRTRTVIVLQAIALVLFQVSVIFAICGLAKSTPALSPILPRQRDAVGAGLVRAGSPSPYTAPLNGKKRGLGPQGLALLLRPPPRRG